MALTAFEVSLHRKGTESYIDADPTLITLIPRQEQIVDGTAKYVPQPPRPAQSFHIIWAEDSGITRDIGPDGGVRRFDFILVGMHDAVVEIGDSWQDGDQVNQIEYKYPDNGYEVKVGGVSHGSNPVGG